MNIIEQFKNGRQIRRMLTASGGPLTLPGKSQEEVDETNNYNKNRAKGLFKGMISGKVLPTMSNIGSMLGAAYSGWLDPETTTVTGDVPNPGMRSPSSISRTANVLAMEKEAPTMFKMLSENPQEMRDLLQEVKVGIGNYFSKVYKPFDGLARKIKTYLETGDKNLLKEIEAWAVENRNILVKPKRADITPKGFTRGNEVTPDMRHPISEEGLTVRTAKPVKLENPITTPEEAQAAKDWLIEQGYEYKPVKLVKRTKPTEPKSKSKVKVTQQLPVVKVEQSAAKIKPNERYTDRRDYTKKERTSDKYNQSYEDGKLTHINSGRKKVTKDQRERALYMITNHYSNTIWGKNLRTIFRNQEKAKAKGADISKYNRGINDILDDFIHNSGYFR